MKTRTYKASDELVYSFDQILLKRNKRINGFKLNRSQAIRALMELFSRNPNILDLPF